MFLIAIGNQVHDANATAGRPVECQVNGRTVLVIAEPLLAQHHVAPNRLVICESVARVSIETIQRLVDRSMSLEALTDALPDEIQTLVIVDGGTGRCHAVSSITSTRPCYWVWRDGTLLISSSLRKLAQAGVSLSFDHDSLPELCCYRVLIPPRTVARGISRIRFGEAASIDWNTGAVVERHLWQPPPMSTDRIRESDILDRVYSVLTAHTKKMTANAGRAITLMSGGLDSSTIGLIAMKECGVSRSLSTSFNFANRTELETEYATSMATHLGLEHEVFRTDARSYLKAVVRAVGVAETPLDHLQSALLYNLFDHYRESGTDLYLTGHFADKLFATDIQHAYVRWQSVAPLLRTVGLENPVRSLLRRLPGLPHSMRLMAQDFTHEADNRRSYVWSVREFSNRESVCSHLGVGDDSVVSSRARLLADHADLEFPDLVPMIDAATSSIFTWSLLSESCGARLGSPFASVELTHFIMSLPQHIQYRKGKHYLKALLRRHGVPDSLINRPKLGFGFPCRFWALPNTLFQPLVDMAGEMFDPKLLASLQVDDRSRANLLWNLLNVYLWRKIFEEGCDADDLATEVVRRHDHLQHKAAAT